MHFLLEIDVPRSSQLDLGPGDKYGTSIFSIRGSSCQSLQSINQTPVIMHTMSLLYYFAASLVDLSITWESCNEDFNC